MLPLVFMHLNCFIKLNSNSSHTTSRCLQTKDKHHIILTSCNIILNICFNIFNDMILLISTAIKYTLMYLLESSMQSYTKHFTLDCLKLTIIAELKWMSQVDFSIGFGCSLLLFLHSIIVLEMFETWIVNSKLLVRILHNVVTFLIRLFSYNLYLLWYIVVTNSITHWPL